MKDDLKNPLMKKFVEFLDNEWKLSDVYDAAFFAEKFNINQRHARYYLNKLVYDGTLCRVEDDYNVHYIDGVWRNSFDRLNDFKNGACI